MRKSPKLRPNSPIGPSGRLSGIWLDAPNATKQLRDRARNNVLMQRVGRELIETGFSIIPNMQDHKIIDQARGDYYQFLESHREEAEINRDPSGRQFRLANFHCYSEAAMKLTKNPEVMNILDFLFGREAAVHTSLTFQYSTMQKLHRDSPYFHTFPEGQFFGVWTALQDIDPRSGPLSYVPGSHRFQIDQWALYNNALDRLNGDSAAAEREALHEYQRIIAEVGCKSEVKKAILGKGDVAIWHPQLVHGGSSATEPTLTRHSMVAHCCPADTFVFVQDAFLRHQESSAPTPYYSYSSSMGRKHGEFSVPGFMGSI